MSRRSITKPVAKMLADCGDLSGPLFIERSVVMWFESTRTAFMLTWNFMKHRLSVQ